MSADIIQFIPHAKRDDMQTDFPTIAFRAARRNLVTDSVDTSSDERTAPAIREA